MSDAVKETCCTRCAHRNVCSYKNDCLAIIKTISEAYVSSLLPNGTMVSKRIEDFEFISDISVSCRHRLNLSSLLPGKENLYEPG